MILLEEGPPVTHPTIDLGCGSFCQLNWDSLVSSGITLLVTVAVMVFIAMRLDSRRPGRIQVWIETLYGYVTGQQMEIDRDARFIVPLALTIFFYILIGNWLDFLPIPAPFHPANSDLNQTAAMAVVVIVVVQWYSIRVLGFGGYLRRFTRPFELPIWARIVFLPLNIIEEVAKPLTLALRLFGNIFGGLLMVWVLTVLLGKLGIVGQAVGVVLTAGWKVFDVGLIGLIQAFIFTLLTIIYFEMAREGLEHDHGSHGAGHAAPQTT